MRELVVACIDTLCRLCNARANMQPVFKIMTQFFRFLEKNRVRPPRSGGSVGFCSKYDAGDRCTTCSRCCRRGKAQQ
jgi:hypothetical protein